MLFKPGRLPACSTRSMAWTIALGMLATLASAGPSSAAVKCKNHPDKMWLTTTDSPAPVDEDAIRKLLARYNWALDEQLTSQLDGLFDDDVFFELCNAAGEQLAVKTNSSELKVYHDVYFKRLVDGRAQPRHIESNTLLHQVDPDTIQGKTTVAVTLQHSDIETPVLDYTGSMRTTFKKLGNTWRFAEITLITDGPRLELRAR